MNFFVFLFFTFISEKNMQSFWLLFIIKVYAQIFIFNGEWIV